MDFHKRAVPSPIEREGKCSPRRIIRIRATAFSQINASFRIAELNVISGTKNTNAWRITTIAKSAINSPAHVARDTFAGSDDCSDVRTNGAPTSSACIGFIEMLQSPLRIQENTRPSHGTIGFAGCQLALPGVASPFCKGKYILDALIRATLEFGLCEITSIGNCLSAKRLGGL